MTSSKTDSPALKRSCLNETEISEIFFLKLKIINLKYKLLVKKYQPHLKVYLTFLLSNYNKIHIFL